ncbi:MAG: hypothetical protein KGL39_26875 [Patescibacteria group bacterium]|nr:hypothetical protein [Patescibacteria group bacterium]
MSKSVTAPAKQGTFAEHNLDALEEMAQKYSLASLDTKKRFACAVFLAEGIQALRRAVEPILPSIMPLQNSTLGFLTDKRNEGYPAGVVLECLVEAVLRGVYPVGNQFNIIAGKCYITKEGYELLVRNLPGLTDLRLEPGVPKGSTGGAVVPYRASWKLEGKPNQLTAEIPVRLNAGMGADGAIGKATRKMLSRIYKLITGSEVTEGDLPEETPLLPQSNAEMILGKLPAPSKQNKETNGNTVPNGLAKLAGLCQQLRLEEGEFLAMLPDGKERPEQLTASERDDLCRKLEAQLEDQEAERLEREGIQS